jgi:hypothetical protein
MGPQSHKNPKLENFLPPKTHHGPDLGEATTFPLIVYYVLSHKANTQIAFCPKIPEVVTLVTLGAHNFVCRPAIKTRSKAIL